MRKIAVALSKGGVGKTTTAVNLAAGLTQRGAKVLLVDTDLQGQASFMLGQQPEIGLGEMLTENLNPEIAITEIRDNLWLLPGGPNLVGINKLIARKDFGGEQTLAEALEPLEGNYDYVVFDTSPAWDALAVNVFFYVQEVLAPVSLEVLTLKGLAEFSKRLQAISKYKDLSLKYIVPNFLDRRVRKSGELLEQLNAFYNQQLCPPIRYNVSLSEAAGYHQTIFEYAPRSPGAEDYRNLSERIAQNGQTENATQYCGRTSGNPNPGPEYSFLSNR